MKSPVNMSRKGRKTYSCKKNQSGIIKLRDIWRNVPDTSMFDAFNLNNIKLYAKKNQCDLPKPSASKPKRPLSKKERDDRHSSRVLQLSVSDSSTDRSLHVKRNNSDPFDKLLFESIQGSDAPYRKLLSFDPKINLTPDTSENSLSKETSKDESLKPCFTATAKPSTQTIRPKKRKKKKNKIFSSQKLNKETGDFHHDFHISNQFIHVSQTRDGSHNIIGLLNKQEVLNCMDKSLAETEINEKTKYSECFQSNDLKNKLALSSKRFDLSKLSACFTPRIKKILPCSTPNEKTDTQSNVLPQDLSAIIISDDEIYLKRFDIPNSPMLSLCCMDTSQIETECPSINLPRDESDHLHQILTNSKNDTSEKSCVDPKLSTLLPLVIIERVDCRREVSSEKESCKNLLPSDEESDHFHEILTMSKNDSSEKSCVDPKLSTLFPQVIIERVGCRREVCSEGESSKYWLPSDEESDHFHKILTKSKNDSSEKSCVDPKLSTLLPQVIIEREDCVGEVCSEEEISKHWLPSDEESDFLGFPQQSGGDEIGITSPDMFESNESFTSFSSMNSKKENILCKLALFPKSNESINSNKNKKNPFKSISIDNNSLANNSDTSVFASNDNENFNSSTPKTGSPIVLRNKKSYKNSPNFNVTKKYRSNGYIESNSNPKRKSTQSFRSLKNCSQINDVHLPFEETYSSQTVTEENESTSNIDSNATVRNTIDNEDIYVTRRKTTNFTIDSDDESFYNKHDVSESKCVGDTDELGNIDMSRLSISELNHSPEKNFRNQDMSTTIESYDLQKSVSTQRSLYLLPGKKYARSLSMHRELNAANHTFDDTQKACNENVLKGRKYRESLAILHDRQMNMDMSYSHMSFMGNYPDGHQTHRLCSITIVEEDQDHSRLDLDSCEATIIRQSISGILSDTCNDTAVNLSKLSISEVNRNSGVVGACLSTVAESAWSGLDARDVVLRRCNQTYPLPFDECYPKQKLRNCCKIGEGVYGEVFLFKNAADPTNPIVMKIIPIEGKQLVNGDQQKKFEEILSEIVTAMELSDLRSNEVNKTSGFNKVQGVRCVEGRYPERLIELWELYDELKGSENDCPTVFEDDQLYIILELANAGTDLEAYRFTTAAQAYSVLNQVAISLAVAEAAFQFEHRDLHWGNVLITPTDDKVVDFTLNGVHYDVETFGVKANIIDFTLSRITLPRAALTLFNNLATDEDLFNAVGDYQFDIYRLMREKNGNLWQHFEPYTNLLWLHYAVDKMIKALRYEKINTKEHKSFISKLQVLGDNILKYDSCLDFVTNDLYTY